MGITITACWVEMGSHETHLIYINFIDTHYWDQVQSLG